MDNISPEKAATYLNNDFAQSYSNTWQYKVVVQAPQTYYNKKFEEKEELREQHVLWELDREKTYFRSAMEKINGQQIRTELENEKLRRTNMLMSLNQCVMDKTTVEGISKPNASHSHKKLPQSQ